MPNTSGKEFDRRYNTSNRRKSSDEDYYSNSHFSYQDNFNPMYRNSSREKKGNSSTSQSSDMKQPLRSYGDWSEFLSSNGKIYFYNRKTERAQWDKPDEWDWLIMQEEKASKNYYQQSGKDNRNMNRFRNKYDNIDMFESSIKPPRYNNYDNHKYHRDYSNDYLGSNQTNTFRQTYSHSMNDRYSNQNMSMQQFPQNSMPINDYYDNQNYPQPSSSSSSSDYYQNNNGQIFRNGYQNKDWINDQQRFQHSSSSQMSKMQYMQNNPNSLNSPNNIKNSPRYQIGQYDDTSMNKQYLYQQRNHLSRYDTFNENNISNNPKYAYNQPTNSSSNNNINNTSNSNNTNINNNTYQNIDNSYNNFNNTSNNNSNFSTNTANNSNQNTNFKQIMHKDQKTQQPLNATQIQFTPSPIQSTPSSSNQAQPRSRANSESNTSSPNNNKKIKISEETSISKPADDEYWDETMEDKSEKAEKIEEKKNESFSQNLSESEVKIQEVQSKPKEEAINKPVDEGTKENQTDQKLSPVEPVLTSTVEDINKYYRPDLVSRLTSCLGVVENLNWINQTYYKHFQYAKLSVDIKNYRSIVRVKEIKKTQQEQRLLFLQSQMKEIEELLS